MLAEKDELLGAIRVLMPRMTIITEALQPHRDDAKESEFVIELMKEYDAALRSYPLRMTGYGSSARDTEALFDQENRILLYQLRHLQERNALRYALDQM